MVSCLYVFSNFIWLMKRARFLLLICIIILFFLSVSKLVKHTTSYKILLKSHLIIHILGLQTELFYLNEFRQFLPFHIMNYILLKKFFFCQHFSSSHFFFDNDIFLAFISMMFLSDNKWNVKNVNERYGNFSADL